MNFTDLEGKAARGTALTRSEGELVLASADLVRVGMLGEAARKARLGDRVTYGRVTVVVDPSSPVTVGEAGEVRLSGAPTSTADARRRTKLAAGIAGQVPLTGFSLSDLFALVNGDAQLLADLSHALYSDGLCALAEVPVDRFADVDALIAAVQAVVRGGLGVWRATVDEAAPAARLDLIDRVAGLQKATRTIRAFAPLPRVDPAACPSTGYDDVRAVAVARLILRDVPDIQVDWLLYGPKLAQVAIAFGASDIDGVAAVDVEHLGNRRSPKVDIERQIRAAAAEPAERTGRYELRS